MNRHQRSWAILLALLLCTAVLYFPSLDYPWLEIEDGDYYLRNPLFSDLSLSSRLLAAWTHAPANNWMPGTWTLGILLHEIVGFKASVFRAVSLLLHLGNIGLLFFLLRRLNPRQPLAIGFAVVFFALHPAQVESVAWISSMKGLLSTALALITLLCFLSHEPKRALGFLAFGGALLCKQDVVALPIILAALSLTISQKQKLYDYIGLLLMSAAAAVMAMLANRGNASPATPEDTLAFLGRPFFALGHYLSHWFVPVGLHPEYRFEAHAHWLNGLLGIGAILLLAVLAIALVETKGKRPVSSGVRQPRRHAGAGTRTGLVGEPSGVCK